MKDLSGQTIGRYHILEPLGRGGMAAVYKAYDPRLERNVAVKVIRTDKGDDEKFLRRFEREAKSLAQLTHPNIVHINDFGEEDGMPYVVMDYLPGGTLKDMLGMTMTYQKAAAMLVPLARSLAYAHQEGIIHRDVKPANVLITASGQPMLTDFGIAKMLESSEQETQLTGTGVGIGTPEYMAPEQWVGKTTTQTDIYALGIIFYEMITGTRPFTADTPAAVLLKQAQDPLPRPKKFVPDLDDSAEQVIIKALAKQPEDRFDDMDKFADALEKLAQGVQISIPDMPAVQETRIQGSGSLVADAPLAKPKTQISSLLLGILAGVVVIALVIGSLFLLGPRLFGSPESADVAEEASTAAMDSSPTPEPVVTAFPTPVTDYTLGDLLFEDRFEGGISPHWDVQGMDSRKPEVIDGRSVMRITSGDNWAGMRINQSGWEDYAIQFDLRFSQPDSTGSYYFYARSHISDCSPALQALQNYQIMLAPEATMIGKQICVEGWFDEKKSMLTLDPEVWHTVLFANIGPLHQVFVDGRQYGEYIDTEDPFSGGGLWLETRWGVEALIDNVIVYEVIAGEGGLAIDETIPPEPDFPTIAEFLPEPSGKTHYVSGMSPSNGDGNPGTPFNTIQAAIDAAAEGDKIAIATGKYQENLLINGKKLTLEGGYNPETWEEDASPEETVLDGSGKGPVIQTEVSTLAIQRFNLINGVGNCANGVAGGGLSISGARVAVLDTLIYDNITPDGTSCAGNGIFAVESEVLVANSMIYGNIAPGGGGGIMAGLGANIYVQHSTIAYNSDIDAEAAYGATILLVNSILWQGGNTESPPSVHGYFGMEGGDPRFVDPKNGDFHLQPDSPAVGSGNPKYALETDIDGDPRSIWASVDVGADEVTGDTTTEPGEPTPGNTAYEDYQPRVSGRILFVNHAAEPGGNGFELTPYHTIQAAIDNAVDADTIAIAHGTYSENLNINGKILTLQGGYNPAIWERDKGPESTIIDGRDLGRAVIIRDSNAALQGLTLTNGTCFCTGDGGGGGLLGEDSTISLLDSIVRDNTAINGCGGGGVEMKHSDLLVVNSTIHNNLANDGAAMFVDSSHVLILHSVVINNDMGGIGMNSTSNVLAANSIIWHNNGPDLDGGVITQNIYDADPMFLDLQNGDFHLHPDSPAVDAGSANYVWSTDIDGEPRPMGDGVDIGLDEIAP